MLCVVCCMLYGIVVYPVYCTCERPRGGCWIRMTRVIGNQYHRTIPKRVDLEQVDTVSLIQGFESHLEQGKPTKVHRVSRRLAGGVLRCDMCSDGHGSLCCGCSTKTSGRYINLAIIVHYHLPPWMVSATDSFQPPNKLWRACPRQFLTLLLTSLTSLHDGLASRVPTKTRSTTIHVPLLSSPSRRAAYLNLVLRGIHLAVE